MPSPSTIARNGVLLVTDTDGQGTSWPVSDNEPLKAAYNLFMPAITPAAIPTDIFTVQGSASKVIRVRSIIITGTAISAANVMVFLNRRSTVNTGGTFAPQTMVKRDSSDQAQTAIINLYSANPTSLGTLIGVADGGRLNIAPAANGSIDRMALQYGWYNDKAIVLRGASDILAFGLNGAALPAGAQFDVSICISEE